ncbi:ssDNA-binding Zn-finger/Zn-ribbon topoisomerase 1 [Rhodoblastus acidophilus]|uniref:hypothetical protein n=1 Tax=Rhodoblastus acidophilus TaxID=1074 RepID=UPI00222564E7|nr:hypothetical protein [Rhodoblastus acidophilus]MCW2317968.1 ssDNA-binding Zn-finger/Zn-ribbon topoisomerase 1 [Rhodoblastus acidophilus]
MSDERCESCRFALRFGKGRDEYVCRRYPPQIETSRYAEIDGDRMQGIWPTIDPYAWCGEFQEDQEVRDV